MQSTIGFFTGTSIGYFTGIFFGGSQTGQSGFVDSIILNLGNWQLHLHHWLIFLISLIFLIFFIRKKYIIPSFIFAFSCGLFSGLIFQGIFTYGDWNQILWLKK